MKLKVTCLLPEVPLQRQPGVSTWARAQAALASGFPLRISAVLFKPGLLFFYSISKYFVAGGFSDSLLHDIATNDSPCHSAFLSPGKALRVMTCLEVSSNENHLMKQARTPGQTHSSSTVLTREHLLAVQTAFIQMSLHFCVQRKQLMYPSLKMTSVHTWQNVFSPRRGVCSKSLGL